MQLVRDGNKPEHESSFYSTFTGPAVYTDAKKYHKVEFKDIESGKAEVDKASPNGFVAMVQHYFASAWLLADGIQRDNFVRKVGDNLYAVGMITPVGTVEPGQTKTVSSRLFSGPQIEPMLEKLSPGLELVKDYGWLTILAKPLYWLLSELHKFIGNWGWSIVALVVLLKIAFYWLNAKAYSSMAKMKAINPKHSGNARAPEGQAAADAAGDDAHLPRGEGQPHGRLPAHHHPDPCLHGSVLGAAVQRGNAQRALDWLDSRPVGAGPVLHPAAADDAVLAAADRPEPRSS
jgi:hypothetical protein